MPLLQHVKQAQLHAVMGNAVLLILPHPVTQILKHIIRNCRCLKDLTRSLRPCKSIRPKSIRPYKSEDFIGLVFALGYIEVVL